MNGCLSLTILGAVFEVLGLGLVAWEITRLQREEFGTPHLIVRLEDRWNRLRRWLRRGPSREGTAHVVAGGRARASGGAVGGTVIQSVPEDRPLTQRVADLETAVETLRRNADADRAGLKQRIQVVQSDVARLQNEIRQESEERERRRKESLRTTITLQAIGTFFFVIGVVLSVIGTAVSC